MNDLQGSRKVLYLDGPGEDFSIAENDGPAGMKGLLHR